MGNDIFTLLQSRKTYLSLLKKQNIQAYIKFKINDKKNSI